MANFNLLELETILRKMGRGVVMYAVDDSGLPIRWDGDTELKLEHLGDTEGEISMAPNETVAALTLPEISGEAVHEAEHVGENPVLSIPLYLANPALLPIVSPTGSASAGSIRTSPVAERTLVVFPERLFRNPTTGSYADDLSYDVDGWKFNGVALDSSQLVYLSMSVFLWRGYFNRPTRRFLGGHGNDAKNIETATFQVMMHPDMPDGERLYTTGNPSLKDINLLGGS